MKNNIAVSLILGFCMVGAGANIAYKAKFIGNMRVTGDHELVYALSVTHCLALCNKNDDCDAITFEDELKKCQLFKRCAPVQMQNASSHYWFFAKRPPISSEGYQYENSSDSCIKLTNTRTRYKEADELCSQDRAYLANLNSPELRLLGTKVLIINGEGNAWVNVPSISGKYSHNNRNAHGKRKPTKHPSKNASSQACWTLEFNQLIRRTHCQFDEKFAFCQIPTY